MKNLTLMLALLCLAACNTLKGVGQDMERAGEALQRAVK